MVKKAVKLLVLLLILINSTNAQSFDSVNFKKDLNKLLNKYGIKFPSYQLVVSNNQKGGQTAFIITNNYYTNPNYVPDSINFEYKRIINDGQDTLLDVFPISGKWDNPFIVCQSELFDNDTPPAWIYAPGVGMSTSGTSNWDFTINDTVFKMTKLTITYPTASKERPLRIAYKFIKKNPLFFIVGDDTDKNKWYIWTSAGWFHYK